MGNAIARLGLVVACAAALGACAGGVGDVNRVQPNYYAKRQFAGDWYYRQTVIDVPYEAGWIFEGVAGDVEKVHFEIQEEALIAYRRNELVPGADGAPDDGGKPQFVAVAGWPITSHFDIVRDYNPSTGEQTNVLEENTTDRPWYEREYIRVDWSKNVVPNQNGLDTFLGTDAYGNAAPVKMAGVSYWVQPHEIDDPDRLELGDDVIGVVGKYTVEPDLNACLATFNDRFSGEGVGANCGATTIKIRHSFLRVDPKRPAYEPLDYADAVRLQPTIDRNGDGVVDGRDRLGRALTVCADGSVSGNTFTCTATTEVECTPDNLARLARDPIHALFGWTEDDCYPATAPAFDKFGYFRTERVTFDRQYGQTDEGVRQMANRWNLWARSFDDAGRPIPLRDRTVQPLVYYLNADFPEDLYGAVAEIERQWNRAFQRTVAAVKGLSRPEDAGQIFEIRPNACSRANLAAYVAGNAKARKVADEIIGGMAHFSRTNAERLCAALEAKTGFAWQKNGDLRYSFVYWVDRPQLAGPLGFGPSYADPDTGEMINGAAYVYGAGVDAQAAFATDVVQLLRGQLTERDVIDGASVRTAVREARLRGSAERAQVFAPAFYAEMDRRMAAFDRMPREQRLPVIPAGWTESRLNRLEGTSFERMLLPDEALIPFLLPGWKPGDPLGPEQIDRIAPLTRLTRSALQAREQRLLRLTARHCALLEEFVDDGVVGLALAYDAGNKSRDEIYADLREKIFVGVALHEVGHTLGLRHNFRGSYDALNYFDAFWAYADLDPAPATALAQAGDPAVRQQLQACIDRSAAIDLPVPSTLDCLRGSEYRTSSVMDYGARFNSDFAGLGKYDEAAIAFGYGQLVEVFGDDVRVPANGIGGALGGVRFADGYRQLPVQLGGVDKLHSRKLVSWTDMQTERANRIASGAIPRFGANGRCTENCDNRAPSVNEVPYEFCSDDYAAWDLTCRRWDEGATQEEIVQSAIDQYRAYYPFWAFKRDRFNWDPNGYPERLMTRVFNHFTLAMQYYYFYGDAFRDTEFGRDLLRGTVRGLNLLAEVIATPEPGEHMWCESQGRYINGYDAWMVQAGICPQNGDTFDVPFGTGRASFLGFDDGYHYAISRMGQIYAKYAALQALTDSEARFYRVDSADAANFSINYYRLFQPEMLSFLGGLVTNRPGAYAGRVVQDGVRRRYEPFPLIDAATLGQPGAAPAGRVLAPLSNYYVRFDALLYGMALLDSNLDDTLNFRNHFQVALKGSDDDFALQGVDEGDPEVYAEVTDPVSFRTFRAVNTSDGHGYGFRLVREAKEILEGEWSAAKAALEASGPADPDRAAKQAAFRDAELKLNDRIEFIEDVRILNRYFRDSN